MLNYWRIASWDLFWDNCVKFPWIWCSGTWRMRFYLWFWCRWKGGKAQLKNSFYGIGFWYWFSLVSAFIGGWSYEFSVWESKFCDLARLKERLVHYLSLHFLKSRLFLVCTSFVCWWSLTKFSCRMLLDHSYGLYYLEWNKFTWAGILLQRLFLILFTQMMELIYVMIILPLEHLV